MNDASKKAVKLMLILAGWFVLGSCLEPYSPPVTKGESEILVIDAFLSDATGMTTVRLSYTASLDPEDVPRAELGAYVKIEGEDGTTFDLPSGGNGLYGSVTPIDAGKRYRVSVSTSQGKSYVSDYVDVKVSPPIDSVIWKVEDDDFNVYISTHDDTKQSRYYLWKYDATWHYRSRYYSTVKFVDGDILQRDPSEYIYDCWKTAPSTSILIGTSAQLEQDLIAGRLLITEPLISEKLQLEYSVLVQQYVLTPEAYEYWEELKKNTENLGTLFGNLPTQNLTNIHCTSHPGEPVIGFFSAGVPQEYRLFIKEKQLPRSYHETGYEACESDTLFLDQIPNYSGATEVISEVFIGITLVGYMTSSHYCVDCRISGGTTTKPPFWP